MSSKSFEKIKLEFFDFNKKEIKHCDKCGYKKQNCTCNNEKCERCDKCNKKIHKCICNKDCNDKKECQIVYNPSIGGTFLPDYGSNYNSVNAVTSAGGYSIFTLADIYGSNVGFQTAVDSGVKTLNNGQALIMSRYTRGAIQGTNNNSVVARYNTDGTVDQTFNNSGSFGQWMNSTNLISNINTKIGAVAVAGNGRRDCDFTPLPDGRILIATMGDGPSLPGTGLTNNYFLTRLNKDGSLDSSFIANDVPQTLSIVVNGIPQSAVSMPSGTGPRSEILPDGKFLVTLGFVTGDNRVGTNLMFAALGRFNSNGTLDTTFGTGQAYDTFGNIVSNITVQQGWIAVGNVSISNYLSTNSTSAGPFIKGDLGILNMKKYTRAIIFWDFLDGTGQITTTSQVAGFNLSSGTLDTTFGNFGIAPNGISGFILRLKSDGSTETKYANQGLLILTNSTFSVLDPNTSIFAPTTAIILKNKSVIVAGHLFNPAQSPPILGSSVNSNSLRAAFLLQTDNEGKFDTSFGQNKTGIMLYENNPRLQAIDDISLVGEDLYAVCNYYRNTLSISSVTIGNSTIINVSGTAPPTGTPISITGAQISPTTINGNFTITNTGVSTFTIPVNTTGSTYISGGIVVDLLRVDLLIAKIKL